MGCLHEDFVVHTTLLFGGQRYGSLERLQSRLSSDGYNKTNIYAIRLSSDGYIESVFLQVIEGA